ncbi:MotA/TolQ/ExbB proton channel family protein [Desulfurobacterium sp.]
MELIARSGFVGYIILALSIATLAVFMERLFSLNRFYRKVKKHGFKSEIRKTVESVGGQSIELVENLLSIKGSAIIAECERGVGFIRLASSIAPLLGLLGTVIGMIEAFHNVAGSGYNVNPAQLADGIWTALLTTAEGLCVAIPAYFGYFYLTNLIEKIELALKQDMEEVLVEVYGDRIQKERE